mmetsp:Transcript_112636/g.258011  ORF Transcript_112636/g.258011 Transcript_112636/m.258011 type:complete len:318 (-) Transcript_112636:668-1621(-)
MRGAGFMGVLLVGCSVCTLAAGGTDTWPAGDNLLPRPGGDTSGPDEYCRLPGSSPAATLLGANISAGGPWGDAFTRDTNGTVDAGCSSSVGLSASILRFGSSGLGSSEAQSLPCPLLDDIFASPSALLPGEMAVLFSSKGRPSSAESSMPTDGTVWRASFRCRSSAFAFASSSSSRACFSSRAFSSVAPSARSTCRLRSLVFSSDASSRWSLSSTASSNFWILRRNSSTFCPSKLFSSSTWECCAAWPSNASIFELSRSIPSLCIRKDSAWVCWAKSSKSAQRSCSSWRLALSRSALSYSSSAMASNSATRCSKDWL